VIDASWSSSASAVPTVITNVTWGGYVIWGTRSATGAPGAA
jgi:hypothetical protein